jgi:hypothetical protein
MSKKGSIVLEALREGQQANEKKIFQPDVVAGVQKLLEYDNQKDRQMLKHLGIDDEIRVAEDMHSKKLTLEKLNNDFKGDIYSVATIKELCVNYRLRMLNSRYYRGKVDVQITAKIKEFARESGIEITDAHLMNRFFIMAPDEAFAKQRVEIPKKVRNIDPVLFYQVDDDHYRLIHKWGNDFSILRAIKGWKWKSEGRFFSFGLFLSLVLISAILPFCFPVDMIGGWLYYGILGVASFVGAFIHHHTNVKNDEFMEGNLTENNWNNNQEFY